MYESLPDFLAWLQKPSALHTVLIEAQVLVGGVDTTLYMSVKTHYTSGQADTPANTAYPAIATVGVLYTEQLSIEPGGDASLSVGEIEIDNHNGVRDAWLDYVWSNRQITAYIGDPTWPRSSFQQIFFGAVADISPKDENTLILKMRDRMQLLNFAVTDAKIGGSGQNKDTPAPLLLGECHNITPVLADTSTLTYKYNVTGVNGPIEVRDGGVPVSVTLNNTSGTFILNHQSYGAVTMSAQGDNVNGYTNTIGQLIYKLIRFYGNRKTASFPVKFTSTLTQFDLTHPQPVGMYITDRTNVIEACKQLAGSVGAQLYTDRAGNFKLTQLVAPEGKTPVMDITASMIFESTLIPTGRTEAVGAVKLGFCKNWTVQTNLTDKIPQAHRDLYAQEWLTSTASDATVQAQRLLSGEPDQQDTLLLCRVDAEVEAQRRLTLWKVPRTTSEFDGVRALLQLELGQVVRVFHRRFGMQAGKLATVISIQPNWLTGHVKVGIFV